MRIFQPIVSGSLIVTGGITGSLFGTASWALNAVTASYVAGGSSSFPYTGSAQITGSLGVTGSASILAYTSSADKIFTVRNSANTEDILSSYGNELTIIGRNQSTEPRLLINRAGSTKMLLGGTTDLSIEFPSSGYGQINTGTQGLDIIATSGDIRTRNSSTFTLLTGNFFGIGQATPAARLDVKAQGALSTDLAFRIRNSADTANLISIQGDNIGNFSKVYFDLNSGTPQLYNTDTTAAAGSSILLGTSTISLRDANANFVRFIGGGVRSIAINNGSANTGLTDAFEMYSSDIVAGNAAPHFRTEAGHVVKLYTQAAVSSSQGLADVLTNLGFLTGSSTITVTASYVSGIVNTPGTSSTSDADFTINSALYQQGAWISSFTADRTLKVSNLTDGGSVRVYIRNTNASARTVTLTASTTTASFANVECSNATAALYGGGSLSTSSISLPATSGTVTVWIANIGGTFVGSIS